MQPARDSERSRRGKRVRGLTAGGRVIRRAAALLVLLLAACGDGEIPRDPRIRERPERIVSLTPNVTEMIWAIGCGERLVAVDSHSDHPPEVRELPDVGGMNPSLERILALGPDVVVGSSIGRYDRLASQLEQRGIRFESVSADRLVEVAEALESLATTLDCSGNPSLVQRIRSMTRTQAPGERPKVLIVASIDPLYVAGHETFLSDLIVAAGARNTLPSTVTGWPAYSIEAVLANPPDIIYVLTSPARWEAARDTLLSTPGWRDLEAVRSGRTVLLDETIATRPGPRVIETRDLIAAGIEESAP